MMPAGRAADATAVWVVHHVAREDTSEETVKIIGVYSSENLRRLEAGLTARPHGPGRAAPPATMSPRIGAESTTVAG
jgi:hypothetical protein